MIDTHIHLDSPDFAHDLESVLARAHEVGVQSFVIPATSSHTLANVQRVACDYDNVYYAVGIHPCHIEDLYNENGHDESVWQQLRLALQSPKCKAIGECGLDFYHIDSSDTKSRERQIESFCAHIELALQHNLPLILHVRDSNGNNEASKEMWRILSHYKQKHDNLCGVFHCYNACALLLDFADSFYYGIGGIVTFKNAHDLVGIVPQIPLNRLVIETDAPYLAPMPHRGKRNESSYLAHIIAKLSQLLQKTETELITTTTKNAKELFNF